MTSVVVTRPAGQAEPLCQLLEQQGISAIRMPILDIKPLPLSHKQLSLFNEPSTADWLIFVSANAVNCALTTGKNAMLDCCRRSRLAAIGQATAKALQEYGLVVAAFPDQGFNSEALLAMPAFQNVQGLRIVCVRGVGGRELLAETLRARGAQVDYLEVYQRILSNEDPQSIIGLVETKAPDAITISSGEALSMLVAKFDTHALRPLLCAIPLVVISDRLRSQAIALGFKQVVVSENPSNAAVFKSIMSLVSGECSG